MKKRVQIKKEKTALKIDKLISIGVPGLDEIFKGGVRPASSILLTGGPGTGKTILALQFIVDGAQHGECSMIITAEDTSQSLRAYAASLGLPLAELEKKGLIIIVEQKISDGRMISMEAPMQLLESRKVKRVVLDSLTLFEFIYSSNTEEFRRGILHFLATMRKQEATVLVTSERMSLEIDNFQFRPEDFLFEGMIVVTRIRKAASYERVLTVVKMRGQEHLLDIYPFTIGEKGIQVFPKEVPFSLVERERKIGKL
ncbi:AAA family ATPase [Candidatus Woesearchaeota archaeon]|nr:AAA family ATPase [Candidatus Woesearchaeota archaeon]